ncbi:Sulfate transporter, CysZ-type, partial [hydrothermal vent metagenome]
WAIPLLIISFIPVINVISPVLWAIFSAWMLALQYTDYPLGNRGYTFSKIRYTLSEHKMLSLGFGGSATIATMIPVLNFLVMPVSVAGATIMAVKALNKDGHLPDKNKSDPLIVR